MIAAWPRLAAAAVLAGLAGWAASASADEVVPASARIVPTPGRSPMLAAEGEDEEIGPLGGIDADRPARLRRSAARPDVAGRPEGRRAGAPRASSLIEPLRVQYDIAGGLALREVILGGAAPRRGPALVRVLAAERGGALRQIGFGQWPEGAAGTRIALDGAPAGVVEIEVYPARFSLIEPPREVRFRGDRTAAAPGAAVPPLPWIDCFGQYARETWPGKITAAAQLAAQGERDRDAARTIAAPPYPHDRYGGLAGSGRALGLQGSGYFRVAQLGGRWWFVTPEGNVFFALGMDGLANAGQTRPERIPPEVYAPGCRPAEDNVYLANLRAKYGQSWRQDWLRVSLARVRAWNFNTLGKYSLGGVQGRDTAPMPYVSIIRLADDVRMVPRRGPSRPVPDVFDPGFEAGVRKGITEEVGKYRDDPWLLGHMVSNEEVWNWHLVKDVLALDAREWPIKRAFVDWVRQSYGDPAAFGRRFDLPIGGAEDLARPLDLGNPRGKEPRAELERFVGLVAERYFSTVARALKAADPNHLYLGNSFGWELSDAAVQAYGRWVDVASFDHYALPFDKPFFDRLHGLAGKPLLIAEHGITVAGRGLRPYKYSVATAEERARLYADYLATAARQPYLVGNFYYEMKDFDIAGKDGDFRKNFRIGFVDVTDQVDAALAAAARDVNGRIYDIRRP